MWESLQELDPTIAAVSTLLVTFSIGALSALYLVQRLGRRHGRSATIGAEVVQ
jgi:hypothetical protein